MGPLPKFNTENEDHSLDHINVVFGPDSMNLFENYENVQPTRLNIIIGNHCILNSS